MRSAVVSGGVVTNIVLVAQDWTPPKGSIAVTSETAEIGDIYSGGVFSKPPPAVLLPPTQGDLVAYAAAKRWQVETGGLNVGGALIDTSIESQNRINGAFNFATANPGVLISFKAASGFVKLTSEQAIAIGQAVGAHVQAGFATEETVVAAIEAGTITTTAEIDAADWPG